MELSFFVKGAAIGFSIAAPVGPIGILCIRRSLADGVWKGFSAGLGAATADAACGFRAACGLTAISGFLVAHEAWLGLFGGVFLCYLGARTFLSRPAQDAPAAGSRFLSVYGSTLLLTLANPATILSFAAVFCALGLGAISRDAHCRLPAHGARARRNANHEGPSHRRRAAVAQRSDGNGPRPR